MLRNSIVRLVGLCTRRPWHVIALAALLTVASVIYTTQNFALSTDTKALFSPSLPWAQRAFRYMQVFPQPGIIVVIDAPTSEDAAQASDRLGAALAARGDVIRAVHEPQSGSFFERNGLLYLSTAEVARLSGGLAQAGPMLSSLSADPSLRGALGALSLGLMGVEAGALPLDELARPMTMAADTAQAALAGGAPSFSWQALASGQVARPADLRRFIEIDPKLDFGALQPGHAATQAIAETTQKLDLAGRYQARVRLTGLVPINDDQFATLKDHAGLNAALTLAAVGVILWLALRSPKIMLAVALAIATGLSVSAAVGLLLVGALNLISVAFFVLFVGLGIDFGIQYSVRYRAERHELGELRPALVTAAKKAARPLALAAAATAVGFASFVPTDYRGLSELGAIAGCGMLLAFAASVTLLPALLAVLKPGPERRPMGFAALAPVDRFLTRRRVPVVAVTLIAVAAASPLLTRLRFDFNPLHLHNPSSPATATFLDLRKDPVLGANAIELMRPDLAAADAVAKRLATLPQVARAMTLSSLVPTDQGEKLALIRKAAAAIGNALDPAKVAPPPSDAQNIEALRSTAAALRRAAATHSGPRAAAATRLSRLLSQLAQADPAARARVAAAVAPPLRYSLSTLKKALDPQPVTAQTIPPALKQQWIAPDGHARIEILPKGDPNDTAALRQFVKTILKTAPDATGPAVLLYEAGNTVVRAFVEAGIFAVCAIFILLWAALRRIADVALTILPLLIAGTVTLELCVALGIALNFANIIALPLLLGVGVAFKIYYIMAWRSGRTALVQSTLTRAVMFSAMTTATAFGSLWMSSDPGTSSMGELMALALACTMTAAVLFQPALMGPPRAQPAPEPRPALPFAAREAQPAFRTTRIGPTPALRPTTPKPERVPEETVDQ
jgi:hypothetical protein